MPDKRLPSVLVCNRTGEGSARPVAGSVERTCSDCGHGIIVSPVSVRATWLYPAMRVLCAECGVKAIPEQGMVVAPLPGQVDELRANHLDVAFPPGTMFRRK